MNSRIGSYLHYSIKFFKRRAESYNKRHKNFRQWKKRQNKMLKLLEKVEKLRKGLTAEELDWIYNGLKAHAKKRLDDSIK